MQELIRDQEGGSIGERSRKLGSYRDQRKMANKPKTETTWSIPGYERAFTFEEHAETLKTIPSYALKRGITKDQARRWRLGFDQNWQRLFISIIDETGRLVGYSMRAIGPEQEPKYLHAKDMARDKYLYGEQFVVKRCRLGFLMEGFMDVLAMERHGWRNTLATMGTKPSKQHIEKLQKWFDVVVIFPHNDDTPPAEEGKEQRLPPGLQMAQDYKNALIDAGVKAYIAPFFKGRKDPGDWVSAEHEAMRLRLRKVIDEFEPAAEEAGKEGAP